ncbi:MAG: FecCD family ABC transporter permease [Betaproteobacteria bacterium]
MKATARAWPVLAVAGAASLLLALAVGSVPVSLSQLLAALAGQGDSAARDVIWQLRAPRAVAGFAVGAGLALSGALLQGLLRNPLADPYVLGISGGAAVAAIGAIALGLSSALVQLAAAAGAMGTLGLLFILARRALFTRDAIESEQGTTAVLLTGVMIASFAAALLSLVLSLAPDARLRTMVFWLLGDLAGATDLRAALIALLAIGVAFAIALRHASAFNLLVRGDLQAYTQGVRVAHTRRTLVLVAALATGAAVTLAGAVGFVGFVAPHLVRLVFGNDQRVLLPASGLAGGTLVVLADTVARSAFAPLQLPVGVVTALVGVPVFLWLLARR